MSAAKIFGANTYLGAVIGMIMIHPNLVNAWSVGGFFGNTDSPLMDDEAVLTAFTDCLRYHWGQRLKLLFPEREFVFETGYEIAGELGFSITFYQKRSDTE